MPTTANQQALHDAFLELAYADQEIVDAEFEELIAASWEPPPPAPTALPTPADRPPHTGSTSTADPPFPARPIRSHTGPARQRSPPLVRKAGDQLRAAVRAVRLDRRPADVTWHAGAAASGHRLHPARGPRTSRMAPASSATPSAMAVSVRMA